MEATVCITSKYGSCLTAFVEVITGVGALDGL